jgi:hypothetical protein
MISSAEFKKHISKPLGKHLREHGFKGSGYHYRQENDKYYFAIGIQGSNYGDKCYVELGIHPKFLETEKIDPKKFKYYDCELRTRIGSEWEYSESEAKNIKTAEQIGVDVIERFEPIFTKLSENPEILEQIKINTDESINKQISELLNGFTSMTTESRLTWVLFEYWKNVNKEKAIEIAEFGLRELKPGSPFFARNVYIKYIEESNRA